MVVALVTALAVAVVTMPALAVAVMPVVPPLAVALVVPARSMPRRLLRLAVARHVGPAGSAHPAEILVQASRNAVGVGDRFRAQRKGVIAAGLLALGLRLRERLRAKEADNGRDDVGQCFVHDRCSLGLRPACGSTRAQRSIRVEVPGPPRPAARRA